MCSEIYYLRYSASVLGKWRYLIHWPSKAQWSVLPPQRHPHHIISGHSQGSQSESICFSLTHTWRSNGKVSPQLSQCTEIMVYSDLKEKAVSFVCRFTGISMLVSGQLRRCILAPHRGGEYLRVHGCPLRITISPLLVLLND